MAKRNATSTRAKRAAKETAAARRLRTIKRPGGKAPAGQTARAAKRPPRARRAVPPPPVAAPPPFGPPPAAHVSAPPPAASSPPPAPPAPVREPVAGASGYIDRGMPVPDNYGTDRLVALVRDPQWLFCYWELHGGKLPEVRAQRGQDFIDACAWVLRVYRINEGVAVDMEIEPTVGNWYIHVGSAGKYQLELGLLSPDGEWLSLLVSQVVSTPRESPSDVTDDEWRLRPEDEEELLHAALQLADARKRGVSGFLGSSRLESSFSWVSSGMLGASGSGRPVAGSWGWSFVGASGRVASSGSGGFGWIITPTGAQEPVLERPQSLGGGPNWNTQVDLPVSRLGKTQQPHFKVKLPRVLSGLPLPTPTWPPREKAARKPRRKLAKAVAVSN